MFLFLDSLSLDTSGFFASASSRLVSRRYTNEKTHLGHPSKSHASKGVTFFLHGVCVDRRHCKSNTIQNYRDVALVGTTPSFLDREGRSHGSRLASDEYSTRWGLLTSEWKSAGIVSSSVQTNVLETVSRTRDIYPTVEQQRLTCQFACPSFCKDNQARQNDSVSNHAAEFAGGVRGDSRMQVPNFQNAHK